MQKPEGFSETELHIQHECTTCEENKLKLQPAEEEKEEEVLQLQSMDEEEEEGNAQLQTKRNSAIDSEVLPELEARINTSRTHGKFLSESERTFFEPRFGYDFSNVQIHTDAESDQLNNSLHARAFTTGENIFFRNGEYSPESSAGRELMAHELTHVIQQNSKISEKRIQTWDLGDPAVHGAPPAGFTTIPANHRNRVRSAMAILNRVVNSRRCNNYFSRNCDGGETARQVLNRVLIWETPSGFGLGTVGGNHVAYDPTVYRIGRWFIASTLLHEMMHACGQRNERTCEMAPDECYVFTPYIIRSVNPASARSGDIVTIRGGFSVGPRQGPSDRIEFGGIDAGRALSWTYSHGGTNIRIRVPGGLSPGSVNVVVINNNIPSNPRTFNVIP